MSAIFRKALITLGMMLVSYSIQAEVFKSEQIEVELVSETSNVVPGQTLWLAIRLDPIEHWHTYWKFGGDSGEATSTSDWQLPAGASAGDIVWPTPQWTPFPGSDLVTFTYEHEVFLPVPVTVPGDLAGDEFEINTKIDWQVCDEICIPGAADFSLTLPVGSVSEINDKWQQGFAEARLSIPVPADQHDLQASFNSHGDNINIMVAADGVQFDELDEAWFFPEQGRVMKYAPFRKVMHDGSRLQISTEQHRRYPEDLSTLNGVLAIVDNDGKQHSWDIQPQLTQVAWDHSIEVELLSETTNVVPGQTIWLGLRLDPKEHWHTYWKMGGDSGEPTSLNDWEAPQGTVIGDIQWPTPYWLPFYDTDLVNFGYEEEVVLPIAVTLPETIEGDVVELSTVAFWNVCEQICIPGEQRLAISLPVADQLELDAINQEYFAVAREQLPVTEHELKSIFAVAGDRVSLGFESPTGIFANYSDAWFFPNQRRILKYGPLRDVTIEPGLLQITHQQPRRMVEDLDNIYGVLVLEDEQGNRDSFEFLNPASNASSTTITPLAAAFSSEGGSGEGSGGLLYYMLAAMLGGLILNLMPCVFPVLSLKALSFAANAGESARRQRREGLAYTLGVVVSFLALASVLIILRAGGERIGWGFQMQQPWFLALIVYLFFTMGLSMSGVFEFGGGLMGVGGGLAAKKGYKGSFFTGVLATVVATPCTAPFMGPALGFALAQPWITGILVFIALGFGMALPILVLSFIPALSRFLPKPGHWMVTFKEFMAFPMYAAALFFLWALSNQVGSFGVSAVLGACILLAFAAWLYQKGSIHGPNWRRANAVMAILCIVAALYVLQSPFLQTVSVAQTAALDADGNSTRDYEVFSTQRLNELQAAGKPVFINMTASWCITCLANEQTTLGTERVKQALADNDITYMKGDWTNEDPEITAILEHFNRPSVPLYVLYPGDSAEEPVILPQILTPGIVADAFDSI